MSLSLRRCASIFRLSSLQKPSTRLCHSRQSPTSVRAELQTASATSQQTSESLLCDSPIIFDTHKMVTFLQSSGMPLAQCEAVTEAMARVSQRTTEHHTAQMVTKSEFVALRSELSILEKADFALLKTDINGIEKRMETSVAEIYTAVERVENRVIKWVIAVAGAIGLAIVRLTTTGASASLGTPQPPGPVPENVSDESVIEMRKRGLQVLDT